MRQPVSFVQCVLLALLFAGCSDHQPERKQAQPQQAPPQQPQKKPPEQQPPPDRSGVRPATDKRLVIGTYPVSPTQVVDGDTLRVTGQQRALRLLAIDTEEMPHRQKAATERLMRQDFPAYVKLMTRDRTLPFKYGTPVGEAATAWAKQFFGQVQRVRLESDTPGESVGTFGRLLCYVWAIHPNGKPPVLYNLEAVRLGWSPYYNKYGRSRRFDAAFRAAQQEARRERRGIWDPALSHYPDYPARIAWWDRRAEALERYGRLAKGPHPPIELGVRGVIGRLSGLVGQQVTVFGVVDDHNRRAVRIHPGGATVRIGGRSAIELELTGSELVKQLHPEQFHGHYLLVRGPLDRQGSVLRGNLRYLRIHVTRAEQVQLGHLIRIP